MSDDATSRARRIASTTSVLVSRIVFAALALLIFVGLAVLTWQGRLDGEAVVLFAGIVLGYVAKGVRETLSFFNYRFQIHQFTSEQITPPPDRNGVLDGEPEYSRTDRHDVILRSQAPSTSNRSPMRSN